MNQNLRYVLIGAGIITGLIAIWYFQNIVAYILISGVLALIGRPIVVLLGKVHIKGIYLPKWLRALITLLFIWTVFIFLFSILIPIIIEQVNELSEIDDDKLYASLQQPIARLEEFISGISTSQEFSLKDYITGKLKDIVSLSFFTDILNSAVNVLGNIFIAVFAISFITFFFLKDENLFSEGILIVVPDKHIKAFKHAMSSTRKLLVRYFIGILLQVTAIATLVTIGFTIIGIDLNKSILIGFIAGMMNVIPYIGPVIGSTLGILIGIALNIELDFYSELLPLIGYMLFVFVIVQVTDNILFQPLIYSSSVHAHPLEVFLVIFIAGSLAGIPGMILAIPSYTVIRVFAKEFFNKFKVVKKLTKNIN